MAQTDFKTDNTEDGQSQVLQADTDTLRINDQRFVSDSDISRDGFDLVLKLESGESLIVEGYFSSETQPNIIAENGSSLTPQLVDSFIHTPHFAEAGTATDVSPVGAVKEITGDATVTRTDGSVDTITLGTPIYEGDVVETSGDGAVNIIFIDETEFAVSEDARLAIDEYVFDPDTSEGTTNFSVLRGVFVFTSGVIGREDPDDVEIDTPVGSIGIRGTIIAGTIDGPNSEITVIEGAIVIRNGMMETTLSDQFETVQLSGFESEIVNVGIMNVDQMNQKFGTVSSVSGSLFSAINDSGEQSSETQQEMDSEETRDTEEEVDTQSEESGETGEDEGASVEPEASADPLGEAVQSTESVTTETGLENRLTGDGLERFIGQAVGSLTQTGSETEQSTTETQQETTGTEDSTETTETGTETETEETTVAPPSVTNTGEQPTGFDLGDDSALSERGFMVAAIPDIGFGSSIAALGDVDGDGFADFAITDGAENLHIHLSGSGLDTAGLGASMAGNLSGTSLSAGGDLDADGELDIIVGAPFANSVGTADGQVGLYNSSDVSDNSVFENDNAFVLTPGSALGESVALLGDINGDGFDDFAIGFDELAGDEGGLLIGNGAAGLIGPALDTLSFDLISGVTSENLGRSLSDAGDLNGDGFSDIIVGTELNRAHVVYGGLGTPTLDVTLSAPVATTFFGKYVFGGSDLNRDGHSDLLISSIGTFGEQMHLYNGQTLTEQARFYTSRSGWEVNSATMMGDYNGDGVDDFAVSTSNGEDSEIFVIYGRESGYPFTVDLDFNELSSFDPALGVVFEWNDSGNVIDLADVGDVNGDGLTDLAIGAAEFEGTPSNFAEDGAVNVVFGTVSPTVVTDGDFRDGNTDENDIRATANDQALLGSENDNVIGGQNFTGLSVSTGAGDDTIALAINGALGHKTIDGGSGTDLLVLNGANGTLDFSGVGTSPEMTISGIEHIVMNGMNQTLRLDISDLFDLLQSTDSNELKITANVAGAELELVQNGSDIGLGSAGFTGELGVDVGGEAGFYDLSFGGYTLLVDTQFASVNFA